jgi:hypothetical protein
MVNRKKRLRLPPSDDDEPSRYVRDTELPGRIARSIALPKYTGQRPFLDHPEARKARNESLDAGRERLEAEAANRASEARLAGAMERAGAAIKAGVHKWTRNQPQPSWDAFAAWYRSYVEEWEAKPSPKKAPTRAKDTAAAEEHFNCRGLAKFVRRARKEKMAHEAWSKNGPKQRI